MNKTWKELMASMAAVKTHWKREGSKLGRKQTETFCYICTDYIHGDDARKS